MNWKAVLREIKFRADRSSGSGGQHVNKVATKVTLFFYPQQSLAFSAKQKERLEEQLKGRLNKTGALVVSEQTYRSQARNKKYALEKLKTLLETALQPPPPARKKLKLKIDKAKKRKAKDWHSKKKYLRRKINIHEV